jgi:hypothetical protein
MYMCVGVSILGNATMSLIWKQDCYIVLLLLMKVSLILYSENPKNSRDQAATSGIFH